ncbi:hypothetical protein QR680_015921 [Steinernema hermaphroditum]|uniref:Uncharacterized protein n=1 Tax=Steinernema hermaphroditum TaxID=289476 RepID=A0AA39HBK6_9BILA|nr:hypothetical protein QR680_015921 [Steinernema hermaphroditum]
MNNVALFVVFLFLVASHSFGLPFHWWSQPLYKRFEDSITHVEPSAREYRIPNGKHISIRDLVASQPVEDIMKHPFSPIGLGK